MCDPVAEGTEVDKGKKIGFVNKTYHYIYLFGSLNCCIQ